MTSLGIGGTNVHVILEEAPDLDWQRSDRKHHLLVLSAKSQNALESLTSNISGHLQAHPEIALADVAYTLQKPAVKGLELTALGILRLDSVWLEH